MAIGVTFVIVAVLIAAVWLIIEVKRMKHKLFAILLIALILFTYISFSVTLKGKDIDFTTVSGLKEAGGLYFSWLGTLFVNMKSITTYAFQQDWKHIDEDRVDEVTEDMDNIWDRL